MTAPGGLGQRKGCLPHSRFVSQDQDEEEGHLEQWVESAFVAYFFIVYLLCEDGEGQCVYVSEM